MNRLQGKVALVTGAARGQGRSHAVELAREGADIIAVDIARDLPELGMSYSLGTADELAETVAEVEELDRRAVSAAVDVRDGGALTETVASAVSELGRLDVVVANAGIAVPGRPTHEITDEAWDDMLAINLTGVWKTAKAAVPHIVGGGRGGSIVLISSMAGLRGYAGIGSYTAAKHGVLGLMRVLAAELGDRSIRVNSIHPTQVDTPMIQNEGVYRLFRPDLEEPTTQDFAEASASMHVLPVPWADPIDISKAVLFLASDDSRMITGVPLPIDAGLLVK